MRIQDKLRGLEFSNQNKSIKEQDKDMTSAGAGAAPIKLAQKKEIEEQVDILIKQATNHENLSACYIGWCPYW